MATESTDNGRQYFSFFLLWVSFCAIGPGCWRKSSVWFIQMWHFSFWVGRIIFLPVLKNISHTHYHLTACVWGGGKFHQATPHPPKKPKLELYRAIYVILKNSLTWTTWLFSWSDSFSFSSSSSFSFLHTMASVSYSLRHRLCLSDKLARRTTFLWTQVEFPVRKSS